MRTIVGCATAAIVRTSSSVSVGQRPKPRKSAKVGEFLNTLKLTMSAEKTLITHASQDKARFLGYEIYVAQDNNRLSQWQPSNPTRKTRSLNGCIQLNVPHDVAQEWQAKYTHHGKSLYRTFRLNSSGYEIVMTYNIEFQGLLNYYALAHNVAKRLSPVRYICWQSLVKTLAAKHQQKSTWVYRRYRQKLQNGRKVILVTVPRDPPEEAPRCHVWQSLTQPSADDCHQR